MLLKKVREYAQELAEKGLTEDEIKDLVAKKIGEEDVTNEDGTVVKDISLELEEKEDEDLEITIKKIAKKAVEDDKVEAKENKVISKSVETVKVKSIPFGDFESKEEAEKFAKHFVPRSLVEKFNNTKALTTYANITTAGDGGSLDPTQAEGILARSLLKYPSYIEDTKVVNMYNSVATFVDLTGDTTAYMVAEAAAGTESKAAYTTRTITAKKIQVLAPVTNEVFRFGSLADIGTETLASMGRAISKKQQHLIFTADGTDDTTDGGITGLIPAINAVASNTTEYIVSGAWSAIDAADLGAIVALVADWADPTNLAWYCHKNQWGVLEGIARALSGNAYLMQVGQKPVPMLFGYPVKFVNSMPSSQSDDATGLLFGDLSGAIATGVTPQTYIDASPDFYFSQDTTVLRAIKHMGVTTYQPGTNGTSTSVVAVNYNSAS